MSLSLFIARRIYRESDSGKQVSRPAVLIAMAGIAIGLAVMIIAVAVVIGFKSEVRNKVIGFGSHIQITNLDAVSSYETHPIVVGDSMMTALADYPEISHVQRFSTKPVHLLRRSGCRGAGVQLCLRRYHGYRVQGWRYGYCWLPGRC